MNTVFGLPSHPLLVHVAVVIVPLARHAEMGEGLLPWVIGLFLVCPALLVANRWMQRRVQVDGPGTPQASLAALDGRSRVVRDATQADSKKAVIRWTKPLLALACITALTTSIAACSTATSPPNVDGSTRTNALAAMHGEAFAHAKYQAYAAQAQQAGHQQAAQAFTSAADTELSDHFSGEADLIGLVSNNAAANLQDAIAGESYEVSTMYPGFARQAAAAGDQAATNLFTEIAHDEAGHVKAFQTALDAINHPGSGMGIPPGPSSAAVPIPPGSAKSSGPTLTNLRTAMQGESYAYAKYTLYAQQARRSGNPALAELFAKTAQVELGEHFAEEAMQAGLVGDTAANLDDAIAGEKHEATTMYPDYARQATKVGDQQAAQLFTEIANDEKAHQQTFEAALHTLPSGR